MISARSLAAIVSVGIGIASFAQAHWRVELPAVDHAGYYTVVLSPEVIGLSQADLSDLRLVDAKDAEVPYLLEHEAALRDITWMRPYTLLRNERVGKRTVIEISADSAAVVDELQLRIRNAEVSKAAQITGSDDRTTWYMVKDQCLSVGEGDGSTSVLRFVDLPASDHRYYRIELNDSLTPPVQVLSLGHSARARSEGRYTTIAGLRSARKEEQSVSLIGLFTAHPFRADRLRFSVEHEGPYLREGSFFRKSTTSYMERRRTVLRTQEEPLGSFTLASYLHGVVQGPGVLVDTLWLRVGNGNDQPLTITGIEGLQLEQRLIARLKPGERYWITTGDAKATAPHYDLEHFRDSIPAARAVLQLAPVSAQDFISPPEKPVVDPSMRWVWGAIIGLGALVAFSAVKLLRNSAQGPPANG